MSIKSLLKSEVYVIAKGAKFVGWYLGHPAYQIGVKGIKAIPKMRGPKMLGFVLMVVGVSVAKSGHHMPHFILEYGADLIGYGIHAAGAIPFLVRIEKFYEIREE